MNEPDIGSVRAGVSLCSRIRLGVRSVTITGEDEGLLVLPCGAVETIVSIWKRTREVAPERSLRRLYISRYIYLSLSQLVHSSNTSAIQVFINT